MNVFEWHPTQQFWQARVVCPARRIESVVLDEGLPGQVFIFLRSIDWLFLPCGHIDFLYAFLVFLYFLYSFKNLFLTDKIIVSQCATQYHVVSAVLSPESSWSSFALPRGRWVMTSHDEFVELLILSARWHHPSSTVRSQGEAVG